MLQYPDGSEYTPTHSNLVEYLYSQVYVQVNQLHIYSGIVLHKNMIRSVQKLDQLYERNGFRCNKSTKYVWDLEVEFKYGQIYLIPLLVLNNYNLLDMARS